MKDRKYNAWLAFRRCRCGWVGTTQQLAILVRRNHVVTKICPRCSSTEILQDAMYTQHNESVH